MSDNAETSAGAKSLMGALEEHKCPGSGDKQLEAANIEDGDRIISKILGDNKQGVTAALAKKTGISKPKTAKMLSMLAPVLLSLIGTETSSNNTFAGGLSSLLSLFTDDDVGQESAKPSGSGQSGSFLFSVLGGVLGTDSNDCGGSMLSSIAGSLLSGALNEAPQSRPAGKKKPASGEKGRKSSGKKKTGRRKSTGEKAAEAALDAVPGGLLDGR